MCASWFCSYEQFLEDVGHRPTDEHQIDRINNEGHYVASNVRWVLRNTNMQNTRIAMRSVGLVRVWYRLVIEHGFTQGDICDLFNVSSGAVSDCLKGKSWKQSLTEDERNTVRDIIKERTHWKEVTQ